MSLKKVEEKQWKLPKNPVDLGTLGIKDTHFLSGVS